MNSTPENNASADQADNNRDKKLVSLADLKTASEALFSSARRKLQIYAPTLDPRVLNNRSIEQLISRFVRSSRNARVEILILDEKYLQGVDHRLVSLAQHFSSYIQIKVIPKDFHENYFAFYLADSRQIIYRPLYERFESECHQLPSSQVKKHSKYFDEVWQQASPASGLRALHL